MKITDAKVKAELRRIRSNELNYDLYELIEDDADDIKGRSEWEVFLQELEYITYCFEESGHMFYEDLENAQYILKETKNGKEIPLDPYTLKPKVGFYPYNIESARNTVNEYRRLKKATARLLHR
jgi:hypothetical protein